MQLLFVSQNAGKIAEAQRIFLHSRHQLITLDQKSWLKKQGITIPDNFVVAESGSTFRENALLKAQAFHQLTKLPCIADDSGLLLAAFPNFPGVNSHRWFNGSDAERNLALLRKLAQVENRRAKFQTVLCLFAFKQEPLYFSGEVEGTIAFTSLGQEGFGYDPIFIPDGYQKTFAQLGVKVKNTISHRALAWQSLFSYLENS
ncbi:RdgB/HAM1 family non-canonical purine NTP pyrophosphatase [Candidatus Woesebacteria bacterium]|jgi:XTP/dITP diphosphohydrolase|nr:RdgB/HAM1 family non-canonical purine NTP pyrophosphatase [Candidatus Woesebacteria bacterium]HNV44853.1 RdgB/HAM1 family non-canonical purine NTP pyrophosphatase [Candidatus Woesebacteria bacterium]HOA12041.1 RdgB/HAM1 family non-canonical purine NTP pyrophosphatase [Candidatus Woesebacteria bacterium]HOC07521.1 RdgB/HAM1 family non-canonical purine NTP pyrophosphatase [Candidatus Woesebacteria bacterium]HOI05264.1 RdgB/HAM1 family non-canonical purine NTP pyrophosphatase [Candidatus Woeseb